MRSTSEFHSNACQETDDKKQVGGMTSGSNNNPELSNREQLIKSMKSKCGEAAAAGGSARERVGESEAEAKRRRKRKVAEAEVERVGFAEMAKRL